jgi:hypothetical protein
MRNSIWFFREKLYFLLQAQKAIPKNNTKLLSYFLSPDLLEESWLIFLGFLIDIYALLIFLQMHRGICPN